jgi:RNA polymerase sigma-70 factor (ECF subfamily)
MSVKISIEDFSIDRFRQGSRVDFRCVYESYYDAMYTFAYNLIRNEAEAQDITTDTFVKLWRLHANFESINNIKAFLYVTNRNACLDALRFLQKQRTVHKEVLYLIGQEGGDIKNEMIDAEVFSELNQKIESLPDKCRKIFKLIYFNNLSTSEVAEEMGISNQNVLNQKARAIHLLRSGLLHKALLTTELAIFLFFFFQ